MVVTWIREIFWVIITDNLCFVRIFDCFFLSINVDEKLLYRTTSKQTPESCGRERYNNIIRKQQSRIVWFWFFFPEWTSLFGMKLWSRDSDFGRQVAGSRVVGEQGFDEGRLAIGFLTLKKNWTVGDVMTLKLTVNSSIADFVAFPRFPMPGVILTRYLYVASAEYGATTGTAKRRVSSSSGCVVRLSIIPYSSFGSFSSSSSFSSSCCCSFFSFFSFHSGFGSCGMNSFFSKTG